jgi:hypothetical protein
MGMRRKEEGGQGEPCCGRTHRRAGYGVRVTLGADTGC